MQSQLFVIKVVNNQLLSYVKLQTNYFVRNPLFMPESNRLLVYDERALLYEYDLQGS